MKRKQHISSNVYIIIGTTVTVLSYLSNKYRNNSKLNFFILLGIILTIWGIGKFLINTLINSFKLKKHYHHTPKYYEKHHEYKFCPKCGTKLRESFNYCYNCGERVM